MLQLRDLCVASESVQQEHIKGLCAWGVTAWIERGACCHSVEGLSICVHGCCADRYFGSFPKVGIVIPNAAAWLLPEFQDLANALEHTLDLPTILPHGARVDPTADGFLLWLPTCKQTHNTQDPKF